MRERKSFRHNLELKNVRPCKLHTKQFISRDFPSQLVVVGRRCWWRRGRRWCSDCTARMQHIFWMRWGLMSGTIGRIIQWTRMSEDCVECSSSWQSPASHRLPRPFHVTMARRLHGNTVSPPAQSWRTHALHPSAHTSDCVAFIPSSLSIYLPSMPESVV